MMSDDKLKIIIPEINTESGLARCGANVKIYLQSLSLFITNIPTALVKMRTFVNQCALVQQSNVSEKDMKDYFTYAHSIKGMCDYIGAEDARKNAKQLEDMAANGDLNGILEHNDNFIKQIERIIADIQEWLLTNEHDGNLSGKMSGTG